ncbi:MAG TPA: hypothetical protein PLD59_15400 [Tepidisphaeraceae bacterium]|nr:hypothetical protein [Tepidisphaeraceae bacterium]
MKPTTSIFLQRLMAFHELVLIGDEAFRYCGQWAAQFRQRMGRAFEGRIIFDVGCYDASFLARVASKHPRIGFVGIDWKVRSLLAGAEEVTRRQLRNAVLIRGRGQEVARIFTAGEVDEIWLFHPEPCDRLQELNNRLFAEPFLLDVHQVLRDGTSTLTLKTDHPGYHQWALGLCGQRQPTWFELARAAREQKVPPQPDWPRVRAGDLVHPSQIPPASSEIKSNFEVSALSHNYWNDPAAKAQMQNRCFADELTHFEHRYTRQRLPIYLLELRKRDDSR